MADDVDRAPIPRYGNPAPIVRMLGWAMLAYLAAFLINNVLNVGFGFPNALALLKGEEADGAIVPWLVYIACIACAIFYVLRQSKSSLRWDAHIIHNFNIYLIRAFFWVVLLVGVVDATIAFMRVEKLLVYFVSEDSVRDFGRAKYVGTWFHLPLIAFSFVLAAFTRTLGFTWLALLIVISELLIVITRFVFSYEQALMGDLVRYWYAALFLFASAYTLFDEGHVRVDVLYAGFKGKTRGFVNAFGSIFLGMSTCWVILAIGFSGKQSIINSPVMNFEITQTGGVGMFVKYQMAAYLGVFAITMLIQFVSYYFESFADMRDEPGHREHKSVSH